MKSAEALVLSVQREQQSHDLLAHRDILNLDTQMRLKHMTLHFLKYAGKLAIARQKKDAKLLHHTLVDTFIICLATANALNVSLANSWSVQAEDIDQVAKEIAKEFGLYEEDVIFDEALFKLAVIAGKMAKSIESTDHLERGNPRAELEDYVVELSKEMLAMIGALKLPILTLIRQRWAAVEAKSIFSQQLVVV